MSCSLFFMVEGVSERVDTPTDRTRLRVGCSTVVIFCCRFGGDHANAAPVLSRRLTRRLTERTGEVGLARKFEGQRNLDQRLVPLPEQLFGELKPLRADIVIWRSADRGLERAGKMEAAQACDRSQAGECQITFQIGSDVIEHTRQSASIKSCLSCSGADVARQRAELVLDQPFRQARRHRFVEHTPPKGLTLK